MSWGIVAGAAIGLVGGAMANKSANKGIDKATQAQQQASDAANRTQLQIFNQQRQDNEPFRQHALTSSNQIMALLGLGSPQPQQAPAPQAQGVQANTQGLFTQGTFANNPFDRFAGNHKLSAMDPLRDMLPRGPQMLQRPQQQPMAAQAPSMTSQQLQQSAFDQWRSTPGYQFNLDEGRKQLESSAAARGGLYSGAALKDLTRFGQNYADRTYGDYMNRLAGVAGQAQTINSQNAQAGQNYANNTGANIMNAGATRASGLMQQGQNNAQFASGVAGLANRGFNNWWQQNQWGGI